MFKCLCFVNQNNALKTQRNKVSASVLSVSELFVSSCLQVCCQSDGHPKSALFAVQQSLGRGASLLTLKLTTVNNFWQYSYSLKC